MILEDFALLASDTARTKAYIQAMIHEEKIPKVCIVYSDDIKKMQNEAEQYNADKSSNKYFNINEPILFSMNEARISYQLVQNKDINSEQMLDILKSIEQKYCIYSGYGGYILKKPLFEIGKKYIHIHAGILPQYRGSTTVYYSFLREKILGATAIFLNERIDEGEIIVQETFGPPSEAIDIDYVYEPYMRSRVLMRAIDKYLQSDGNLTGEKQDVKGAETYFIIHPVLKHLALMGMEQEIVVFGDEEKKR